MVIREERVKIDTSRSRKRKGSHLEEVNYRGQKHDTITY